MRNKEYVWRTKALRKKGNFIALPRYYVKKMDQVYRLKPSLKGKSLELLLFDGSKATLASWIIGRHRWRLGEEARLKNEERISSDKRKIAWYDIRNEVNREERQRDRIIRANISIKESER